MSKNETDVFSINCRVVGPGGTTVKFYPTREGLKGVWVNENCPYNEVSNENTQEARNGENVSFISWGDLERALKKRP